MRQTLRDIEIIVADDGSTDNGRAVAERIAATDPRIRVLAITPNGGKPAAMNRMIAEARGEWVAVLDADDAFDDHRLETLVTRAEAAGVEMAADNIVYVDGGADQVVQTAFDPSLPDQIVATADLVSHSDSYAEFDFGILKPVIRRAFLIQKGLHYFEQARLSEDFYYLMNFFLAGGRGILIAQPGYFWTMPFGAISREWTSTGSGAWRYDYRRALVSNEHFITELKARGDAQAVAMLEARSRQYKVMIHYIDAQRAAASGQWGRSLATIATHPATYALLARRVFGRLTRRFRPRTKVYGAGLPHPRLRPMAHS